MTDHHLGAREEGGKPFGLGCVLSITTDRLVSEKGIGGVYEILNYMTGENLYTHQLPRVSEEARPVILAWHPQLANVDASSVTSENWRAWLADQKARFGETLAIPTLDEAQHERIDPLSEAAELFHPDKIITVRSRP